MTTRLLIETERDHRHPADRIRHLEAQVDALRALIAMLKQKIEERERERCDVAV